MSNADEMEVDQVVNLNVGAANGVGPAGTAVSAGTTAGPEGGNVEGQNGMVVDEVTATTETVPTMDQAPATTAVEKTSSSSGVNGFETNGSGSAQPQTTGLSNGEGQPSVTAPMTSASRPGYSQPSAEAGPSSSTRMRASPPPLTVISPIDHTAIDTPVQERAVYAVSSPQIARTGYIYDPLMMLHCKDGYEPTPDDAVTRDPDPDSGHPEDPLRIKRIFSRLAETGLIKRMKKLRFEQVTMDQVLLVHSEELWNKVQGIEGLSDQYMQESRFYYDELSLYICRETARCARLSCGGVVQACLSVCSGEVRNAFAIVRPPGHHAEPDQAMGFCFFNNVAVGAREVIKQGLAKKVLILDWDVHHGNGTQKAVWDDPNVLYISIHRHDAGRFYPTSDFGALDQVGIGAGEGMCVNIPWPSAGFGDADYIHAFQKIVMPIAYEFGPDLVIISAGFDAAHGDHIGQCNVTPPAYGHMTHMLCALAGGKVVVALEGGYNFESISRSSLAVASVLLGETPPDLGPLQVSEVATEVVSQVARVQSKYWKSIDVRSCEVFEASEELKEAAVIPIPDLLKIHRAHHLFSTHELFQIPLANSELEDAFGGQVLCSEGVYEAGKKSTLVVFVHDFGNLRVETDGILSTNIHLTNSYLLDTSDAVVNWVNDSGFSLIDVNVLAQLPTQYKLNTFDNKTIIPKVLSNKGPHMEGTLMKYIWDNYIELSEAENVILIGHGTGCGAVMELVNNRDVQQKVKAVVQVAGMHSLVRIDPKDIVKQDWFRKSNQIYVPQAHEVLKENDKFKRRLGSQIFTSEKAKVVDVLVDVLPRIKDFVEGKIVLPTNGAAHLNGTSDPSVSNPIAAQAA